MILSLKNIIKKTNSLFYKRKLNKNVQIVEWPDGSKFYYCNDKLHRLDSPAIEYYNGDKHWYLNGLYHRINGPAIEYFYRESQWLIYDQEISSIKDIMDIIYHDFSI